MPRADRAYRASLVAAFVEDSTSMSVRETPTRLAPCSTRVSSGSATYGKRWGTAGTGGKSLWLNQAVSEPPGTAPAYLPCRRSRVRVPRSALGNPLETAGLLLSGTTVRSRFRPRRSGLAEVWGAPTRVSTCVDAMQQSNRRGSMPVITLTIGLPQERYSLITCLRRGPPPLEMYR